MDAMNDIAMWVVDAAESCALGVEVRWVDPDHEQVSLDFAPDVGSCVVSLTQARNSIGRVREAAAGRGVVLAVVDRLGVLASGRK